MVQQLRTFEQSLRVYLADEIQVRDIVELHKKFMYGEFVFTGPEDSVVLDSIERLVCVTQGITAAQVKGKRRNRPIAFARQLIIFLSLKYTRVTLKEIGARLGDRDHTTAIHSRQLIQNLMDTDPTTRRIVRQYQDQIEKEFKQG